MSNYMIITAREAEADGFIIDGQIGFLFNLGCTTAILAFNSLDKMWQFDTGVDAEGDTWQFVEPDFHKAMAKAEDVAATMQCFLRNNHSLALKPNFSFVKVFVKVLNAVYE